VLLCQRAWSRRSRRRHRRARARTARHRTTEDHVRRHVL